MFRVILSVKSRRLAQESAFLHSDVFDVYLDEDLTKEEIDTSKLLRLLTELL